MYYSRINNTICFGDVKQAALYFDHVIPLDCAQWIEMDRQGDFKYQIYADLLGLKNQTVSEQKKITDKFVKDSDELFAKVYMTYTLIDSDFKSMNCSRFMKDLYSEPGELIDFMTAVAFIYQGFKDERYLKNHETDWSAMFATFHVLDVKMNDFNFRKLLFLIFSSLPYRTNKISLTLPPTTSDFLKPNDNDLTFTLSNIPLIDTSSVDWETIIDIRNNQDAKRKLTNLRLFMHKNYVGKSKEFIEDDLSEKIMEYENICRDYRIETKISMLSSLMHSKSILAMAVTSVFAILVNEPMVASTAMLSGVSLEIGKICLEAAKRKHAFHVLERNHELAYIIDCKSKFKRG